MKCPAISCPVISHWSALLGKDFQEMTCNRWFGTSMNGCSKRPSSTVFPIWNVGHVVNKARWVGSWFLLGFGIALRGYFKIFFCACVSEMIDMGVLWFGNYGSTGHWWKSIDFLKKANLGCSTNATSRSTTGTTLVRNTDIKESQVVLNVGDVSADVFAGHLFMNLLLLLGPGQTFDPLDPVQAGSPCIFEHGIYGMDSHGTYLNRARNQVEFRPPTWHRPTPRAPAPLQAQVPRCRRCKYHRSESKILGVWFL